MRRTRIIAILAAAALSAPAQAQEWTGSFEEPQVELISEMWALAGVCTQYSTYSVRNDALADFLNAAMGSGDNGDALIERKNAKVEQISAAAAAVSESGSVTVREERSDRLTASLMTRCRALTNNPVASRFFFTATG